MQVSEYENLKKEIQSKGSSNLLAGTIIFVMTTLTCFMIYISATQTGILWLGAQMILGILILQWFFLVHDMGHGHFFTHPKLNMILGHLASFFVMLPFFPWRYIHRHHHLWTGWKDKDPTMSIIIPDEIPALQKTIINFCWKFWIPIFGLAFSFSNFWNVSKLTRLFPEKKAHFYFSMAFVILTHLLLIYSFGAGKYFHTWGLAYLIFLVISDPLLLSQHIGIPQFNSRGKPVVQLHFREQDEFTRSLVFPQWMQTFIFLGFNSHSLHHLYPTLPGYRLCFLKHDGKHDVHWYEWLKSAKKVPGIELIVGSEIIKDH